MSTIKIGEFRRSVRKTVVPKTIKFALRAATKDSTRVSIGQTATALNTATGRLVSVASGFILGSEKFTTDLKTQLATAMGDVGFELVALGVVLKAKIPASTKKAKLVGTRSAAILKLQSLTTEIQNTVADSVFGTPKTKLVKKIVTMPKTGAKEEREIVTLDAESEKVVEDARREHVKTLLDEAIDTYWRLSFDMLGHAPAEVFAEKFDRMKVEFPNIDFTIQPKAEADPAPAQA